VGCNDVRFSCHGNAAASVALGGRKRQISIGETGPVSAVVCCMESGRLFFREDSLPVSQSCLKKLQFKSSKRETHLYDIKINFTPHRNRTILQCGRSQFRFRIGSLIFSIDLILPATQ
jgi:hypothetical protein